MSRLETVITELEQCYKTFNTTVEKPLPSLSTSDQDSLKKLLDAVIRRESFAVMKKQTYPTKMSVELRRLLADLLLLNDGVDVKKIKQDANPNKNKDNKENKEK